MRTEVEWEGYVGNIENDRIENESVIEYIDVIINQYKKQGDGFQ